MRTESSRIHIGLAVLVWGLVSAPGSIRASIHPSAIPIVTHYVEATGGRAALDAQRGVYLTGRMEAEGLEGRWETWYAPPDRFVRKYTLGSLKIREGYDGATFWRTDLSARQVTILSASDATYARDEGWFLNEMWAREGEGGGDVRMGSRSYGSGGDFDMLTVTPPNGRERRLLVNSKTGFIERVHSIYDQYHPEERVGDYRRLASRKRPTTFQSPTLLPGDKPFEKLTTDSARAGLTLDSAFFAPPEIAERRIRWVKAKESVRLPFKYDSKAVWVKVSLNGAAPVDFILDTGASLTAVDKWYAREIGLRSEGESFAEGMGSAGDLAFARVASMSVVNATGAGVVLGEFRVGLLEMADTWEPVTWRRCHGLLGYDFLSRFVVDIDYDTRVVTLSDPAHFKYAGTGSPVPMELHQNCPVIDVTVNGKCSGKFLVDVGNSFHTLVYGSLARPCGLVGTTGHAGVEVLGGGVGSFFGIRLQRLDSLSIGPFRLEAPVAGISLHTRGGVGSQDYSGNLGCDALEHFHCTFDYAGGRLWLAPSKRYADRESASRLGVLFAWFTDHVLAGNVLRGSPADEAGIKWDDVIVSIDDKPALKWTREEIDRVLDAGAVGSVHRIMVRHHDATEETFEIELRDML